MKATKIWRMMEPFDTSYAQCGLRSPVEITHSPCSHCTIGDAYVVPRPLAFEWEPGSDQVGDFAWPGGGRVAVTRRVLDFLQKRTSSVEGGEIEMVQDPKLKRPKNPRKAKPRVWLPYSGPELLELIVGHYTHALPETTTEIVERCEHCGRENHHLIGAEVKHHKWSIEVEDLVPFHQPRVPGQGVFVSRSDVEQAGIFLTHQFSAVILCTSEMRALLEEAKLTNLDFLEYGDLV